MKPLLKLAKLLSPSCKQASRLQSEAMDRNLSLLEALGLRLHLVLCKWCRRYGQQLKFLRRAAHQCGEQPGCGSVATLAPEARQRMKQKLRAGEP